MSEYAGYPVKLIWEGTALGQVRDINGPATQASTIDVTTRDDSDQMAYIDGLRDGGEVTFDLIYDPDLATHVTLLAAFNNATLGMMELQTLDTATNNPNGLRFFAYVTGFVPKSPLEDALTADVACLLSSRWAEIDYLVDHDGNYLVDASGNYLIA